jgi:hypothetical protein
MDSSERLDVPISSGAFHHKFRIETKLCAGDFHLGNLSTQCGATYMAQVLRVSWFLA